VALPCEDAGRVFLDCGDSAVSFVLDLVQPLAAAWCLGDERSQGGRDEGEPGVEAGRHFAEDKRSRVSLKFCVRRETDLQPPSRADSCAAQETP
jgi:hypothetical protein